MVMDNRERERILPANALLAFESAARHASFTLAARELRTSQAAISRQIAKLETWLSARLFERSRAGVTLTEAGERFRNGVAAGLAAIHRGAAEATELSRAEQVVIACSHDASHFLITPHYGALRQMLGEDVRVRVLIYHFSAESLQSDPSADILLTWNVADTDPADRFSLKESVRPVCSPAFAAAHRQVLDGPVAGWGGLTFLDLVLPNAGWATWEDWFAVAGRPAEEPRRVGFDCLSYSLEAAVAGHGIALGWRYFMDRQLQAGALVTLGDGFVDTGNIYCGVLTETGRRKPVARRCLEFFERLW